METSTIHGLAGNVKKLHMEMQELRRKYGVDATLKSHLADNYGGLTPDHLYADLQIDPRIATVENLLTMGEDTLWLVPEVIRDAIRKGFVEAPIWPDLVAADEPVSSPAVRAPHIEISEAVMKGVAEGGTIPVGSVVYGDKTVNLSKQGIGIDVTYETIRFSSINLLSVYLLDVGARLGSLVTKQAIETLINGDQDDASEAAAVIGVEDTEEIILYMDFLRIWTRMSRVGGAPDALIANEDLILTILDMEEFKKRYAGAAQLAARLKTPLPTEQNIFVNSNVTTGKILFNNKSRGMVKVTAEPLMIEADRIIDRQIEKTVASVITGFVTLQRTGRAMLDTALAYAENGWPTWFAPIE